VQLEGLGQLKNPVILSEIEPATFRLVAWCLNQLRYRVPPISIVTLYTTRLVHSLDLTFPYFIILQSAFNS
jgi:hypothetical protein